MNEPAGRLVGRLQRLGLLAEAGFCLALTTVMLRVRPARALPVNVETDAHGGPLSPASARTVAAITAAVTRAARLVPGSTCLAEALAAKALLARRGIPTALRIGIRRDEDRPLAAHAWLEWHGTVVLGTPDRPYHPLSRPSVGLPPGGRGAKGADPSPPAGSGSDAPPLGRADPRPGCRR